MSTTGNAIAGIAGTAVGSALAAPVSGAAAIITAISSIARPLIDLIPDPKAKLEAQQHIADQQFALQQSIIDQQNKVMAAATENLKNDPHTSGARAYFCYGVTTLILANYGILPLTSAVFHWSMQPFQIPSNVLWIFATIMLGFVGVPSVMETLKSVMGLPGESQVNVLGMKAQNKS